MNHDLRLLEGPPNYLLFCAYKGKYRLKQAIKIGSDFYTSSFCIPMDRTANYFKIGHGWIRFEGDKFEDVVENEKREVESRIWILERVEFPTFWNLVKNVYFRLLAYLL